VLWTFSGRRGVHCRVFDDMARAFGKETRAAAIKYCLLRAKELDCDLRLDEPVTKDPKHLIKVPFTVNPKTGKLVVPFNPEEV
jgi:DNA primase catalytic subunit